MRELNQAEVDEVTGGVIGILAEFAIAFAAELIVDGIQGLYDSAKSGGAGGNRYDKGHQEAWHKGFHR